MEMEGSNSISKEKKAQIGGSWIPGTPVKPIAPKPAPIYSKSEGNQVEQANWPGSRGFPFLISQEFEAYLDSNKGIHDWEVPPAGRTQSSSNDTDSGQIDHASARFVNISFRDQLALADARSTASTSGISTTLMSPLGYLHEPDLQSSQDLWLGSDVKLQNNFTQEMTQYGLSYPYGHPYNLNSVPSTVGDLAFSETVSTIVPVTPEKSRKVGNIEVPEIQNVRSSGHATEEGNKDKGVATTGDDKELDCDKELLEPIVDSSGAAVSTQVEDHNPDMGDIIDLNKTPQQQKQRRRKHRPKVVIEGKPKRAPNPAAQNPTGLKETSTGRRKYVRRSTQNKSSTETPAKETEGIADSEIVEPTRKSCRRALNFNSDGWVKNIYAESSEEDLTVKVGEGTEPVVETTEIGTAHELNLSKNEATKDNIMLPGRQDHSLTAKQTGIPQEQLIKQDVLRSNNQTALRSPNNSNCSASASPTEEVQARGLKRGHSDTVYQPQLNLEGAHYSSSHAFLPILNADECKRIAGMHFPEIYKKKRTEKVTYSITSSALSSISRAKMAMTPSTSCHQNDHRANLHAAYGDSWISDPQLNTSTAPPIISKNTSDKMPMFQCMPVPSLPERSTKKRTRGHTRVRDLASLNGIICFKEPGFPTNHASTTYGGPNTCIDALVAETRAMLSRKKRSKKRNSVLNSVSPGANKGQLKEVNIIYGHQQFFTKAEGSLQAVQRRMFPIDALVEQLKNLNINNQTANQDQHALVPYNVQHQEQNALVLYRRDGTIVPFEGPFNPIKKRRPRPKVDLDEETTRVWQLLMANINSEGIDGTDEQKEKWWEEERRVFHGRADSFIARMRLVQGDRRFSPWKGSVLDSVIGVFLTQNVSDHLSSSAFMSLAAHFPLKSKGSQKPCHEGKDPGVCDPNNFESSEDKEGVNNFEYFGCNSGGVIPMNNSKLKVLEFCESAVETNIQATLYASRYELDETKTSLIEGEGRQLDDEILSQNSVVSSQNSTNSSVRLTGERIGSCSDSNSEAEEPSTRSKLSSSDGSNTFMEFLRMAGATIFPEVHSQGDSNMSSNKNSGGAINHSEYLQYDQQRHIMERLDDPKNSMGSFAIPSNNLMPNSEVLEVGCIEALEESMVCEQSGLKVACISQATVQNKLMMNVHEATQVSFRKNCSCEDHETQRSDITQSDSNHARDKEKLVESFTSDQNEKMQQYRVLKNSLAETSDGTESTSKVDNEKHIENLTAETNIGKHKTSSDNSLDVMKSNTSSGKRLRVRKAQEKVYNWDNLRKEAQVSDKKSERTSKTMDSLDWEAVRCADVNEIAETIKERGMNNMLAERIKAFLNRLVEEHGSIDLEWLRDVPPDKAKEYLLSVRGLGLKSVECVRLLTLHQLAFPVDTNVGRIAVRLGWVPLQPLPESLQLHLLELYPVLESIQKYLWPRLCKLDQRTLYELHYQMITFGKVFCTKSKPNCNACPMRGECRHFASAFASARLALPGPEEKSLVSTTESRAKDQGHAGVLNSLPLPLPQLTPLAESKSESGICKPIIEEPATPEPECTPEAEIDIEDTLCEDPNEIPTIKLNIEEFTQNLHNYMQNNMELQEGEMTRALVALNPEAASIPMPKLKNVNRLRTEHQVYELPDSHPLLAGLDEREPDDPCSYLLAIWTPGETANSIQPPEGRCNYQEYGKLCDEETCFSCNSIKEANSQIVRGTLLIPCRTAMRGSFPLNGTYFQVNEVFADHDSSLNPIDIPRSLIWNLPRRTVYFGTSIPSIFKGLSTEGIQHCFWRGYVCVRGFDQKTRAPRPLMARLHFPASKLTTRKGEN